MHLGDDYVKHYLRCEPSGPFSEPSIRDVLALKKTFGFQRISEFRVRDTELCNIRVEICRQMSTR